MREQVLKEYSSNLTDLDVFSEYLSDWLTNKLYGRNDEGEPHFASAFSIDELHTFDFAVEGIPFQQILRMPYSPPTHGSDAANKEDEFLALEDFIYTAAEGLWQAFWHRKKPLPFYVACPSHPRSKFYTVEKAVSKGTLNRLSGAALIFKKGGSASEGARWVDVVKFVLFRQCLSLREGEGFWLSHSVVSEAVFYAIHMLISRSLRRQRQPPSTLDDSEDCVFVSVVDPNFGGVVKLCGDLSKLEVSSSNPYRSMAEWITLHADISISPVDQIWNKLGNVNWGDLGALQVLLATLYSMIQWHGPPRKSMASLAARHSLRLQKRRMETQTTAAAETENALAVVVHQEAGANEKQEHGRTKEGSRLILHPGEIILLEDRNQGLKSFLIQENVDESCYIAVSMESPREELMTLYVGAHPSRLKPSWEDMNLWYLVQRQTKILNIMKGKGAAAASNNLPEIVASGRIVHSGYCDKESPEGRCSSPWCGTPILVVSPFGETLSAYPISAKEAGRCCRDCLAALRSARMANILHGDIRPENIIRAGDSAKRRRFVLVSWGRAVTEERDSPPMNLQFSSAHALQHGKLCPSSDVESLVYLMYFVSGGSLPPLDSIESALKWRKRNWAKRVFQQRLGEISPILKAFADYVDSICGTPYPVDYDVWLRKLNSAVDVPIPTVAAG
ncbi:hypothetical protein M569_04183 [Genlisea aurea]|uniref:Fungal-type protein kinase domain-containing protein n=1 Tax=Genlisea aurea TaxID=192259 RepID=S8EDG0_9LAMI|nr:hypothetical protein M569_04183 [Genlisea aurea]